MKMFEPISRMKRSTDNHQKTIVFFILIISAIVPAIGVPQRRTEACTIRGRQASPFCSPRLHLAGIITFRTGCMDGCKHAFKDIFDGAEIHLGEGCLCFLLSVVLLVPIALIHVIIPAAKTTALDDNYKSTTTVEMQEKPSAPAAAPAAE